jgi:hypothetical protein
MKIGQLGYWILDAGKKYWMLEKKSLPADVDIGCYGRVGERFFYLENRQNTSISQYQVSSSQLSASWSSIGAAILSKYNGPIAIEMTRTETPTKHFPCDTFRPNCLKFSYSLTDI